ncbi:MAG: hypothetical protein CMH84_15350 [Nocardioides sp.]|nr:hypothetical protein [Nocardioides sp.]|tara:strand:- start:1827 stop:2750 length:924 start_codon:yes stop_codon:yes gene_type:complete
MKSEPGDRTDVVAYEALCAALEAKAATMLLRDSGALTTVSNLEWASAGSFVRSGSDVIVGLSSPLQPGKAQRSAAGVAAPEPAASVDIRDDIRGRRLVEARFREQLKAAIAEPGKDRSSAMSPSGIHNRVLTEVLRAYVDRGHTQVVTVPVVYRDGSKAEADFPFHCLDLVDQLRPEHELDLNLRLTLLSIRHTEMDPVVDGAWLRNAEVSRPRPAAQTDDFVYYTSRKQLDVLTRQGTLNVRLHIFQTGLETAVVGFFRAVVEFLRQHPGRLEVVPMFYAATARRAESVEAEFAGFEPGQVWATKE